MSGSIGTVQPEADDDHNNSNEAGNQEGETGIPEDAPQCVAVFKAE